MGLTVAQISLVSPLGLGPSEHVFFWRGEVSPHASGAFTTPDGEALPIHDCAFIPASRPLPSRLRLLAKQALARVGPSSPKTPVLLIGPEGVTSADHDLVRFLTLSGHNVGRCRSGAAAFVSAFAEAEELLKREPEVIVLGVDSLISKADIEHYDEVRYSGFTRNPAPPSEGAAALRLVASSKATAVGEVRAFAAARSEASDLNDLASDGVALTSVFGELALPPSVPLVVGPRDVDPLRVRDFHLASVRHHGALQGAEMPSLEGKMGLFGSASGVISTVFALAWLRHGLPTGEAQAPPAHKVALAWARSRDGAVGAALLGGSVA